MVATDTILNINDTDGNEHHQELSKFSYAHGAKHTFKAALLHHALVPLVKKSDLLALKTNDKSQKDPYCMSK